jgi:hypothetical protein
VSPRVELGPLEWTIAAPPQVVFRVVAAPYLGRTPRALADKLEVLERRENAVTAAHHTRVLGGIRVTTVEDVAFDEPHRVSFHLVSGPVRAVEETFELLDAVGGTRFVWAGHLESRSRVWARIVARRWTIAVRESLAQIAIEAERRAR